MADFELSKILSGDPLPRVPVEDDPDIDKWRRDVVSYLRRLTGKLTNQAIDDAVTPTLIWEDFNHTNFTIFNTPSDNDFKVLRTVSIPANTIRTGFGLQVEAWGRWPVGQIVAGWIMRFTLGGVVVADQTPIPQQGVNSEHWFLRGVVTVGVNGWIWTARNGNTIAKGKFTTGGIDLTIDNDFTIDVDGPNAITQFSIDVSHLRQSGTRTPPT